jgi:hypothetical protein
MAPVAVGATVTEKRKPARQPAKRKRAGPKLILRERRVIPREELTPEERANLERGEQAENKLRQRDQQRPWLDPDYDWTNAGKTLDRAQAAERYGPGAARPNLKKKGRKKERTDQTAASRGEAPITDQYAHRPQLARALHSLCKLYPPEGKTPRGKGIEKLRGEIDQELADENRMLGKASPRWDIVKDAVEILGRSD